MNKFEASKIRWRQSLVATPEQIAAGDENVKNRAKDIGVSATKTWNTLRNSVKKTPPAFSEASLTKRVAT